MSKEEHTREWVLDDEIHLFDLICDFKPAGQKKDKQMASIVENMNKGIPEDKKPFTAAEIWQRLGALYDLEKIDELEDYKDESESNEENEAEKEDQDNDSEKDTAETNEAPDSSGLSDVEGELPSELESPEIPKIKSRQTVKKEKDVKFDTGKESSEASTTKEEETGVIEENDNNNEEHSNDDDGDDEQEGDDEDDEDEGNEEEATALSHRVTRGVKKHQQEISEQAETPRPKKRTRSSAKLDAVETPPPSKRSQRTATPPVLQTPTASAKRRKKSEVQDSDTEKANTRRSTRSSIPASTPLKQQAPVRRSSRKK